MEAIQRTYYNLLNSGNLFRLFPSMTGRIDEDIVEFTVIYQLLNA